MSEAYQPKESGVSQSESYGTPDTPSATPSVVSIADIEASKPSVGGKIGGVLSELGNLLQGRIWIVGVLIVALMLVFLFLPPISLGERITSGGGYEMLNADNPEVVHPDGIKVSVVDIEGQKMRVKLETIPMADFVGENIPKDIAPAVDALPAHLTPKSPYYILDLRGNGHGPASIEVVIPNAAEPWETLDLYNWDGEVWQWLPTTLDRINEVLISDVDVVPSSVMVMQSGMVQQKIVSEVEETIPTEATTVLTEIDVSGMLIGTMGGLTGDATQLPMANQGGNMALVPVIRNWVEGRDPNWALVSDMLNLESDRKAHVQNLIGLVQSGGYPGLVLDYRSVHSENREVYVDFVKELATALHENNQWLAVVVEPPQQMANGTWDTNGYDWSALGAAADQLRIIMPTDPTAYASGGAVEQLLTWTIAHVNRYKVVPVFTTLSTDGEKTLTLADLLEPLGTVQLEQQVTSTVKPGTALSFKLGEIAKVEVDPATGVSCFVLSVDTASLENSEGCTAWLGTAQWLRTRMDLVSHYHLGGVMLRNLFDEGNFPNLIPAIADFQAQVAGNSYAAPEITWQITSPNGQSMLAKTLLTQPQLTWTTPDVTGTYAIAANVAGLQKGQIKVQVDTPRPIAPEEETEETEETETSTVQETKPVTEEKPVETSILKAAFVTDVSIPDNTQMEKGEKFTKTWRVKNAGSDNWPKETVLAFSSGEKMAEASQVEVGEVAAGETVDISVDMTSPDKDGTFKGLWWLKAGDKDIDGGGMIVIIKAGEEQAGATTGTASAPVVAPVSGGSFEMGGHVRDIGLPYADKMHYAGMNWSKVQVRYGEDASGVIALSHSMGFKIQLSALGSPGMVVESGFAQDFASWVAGLAAAGADAIEVWNEPNIDREWQIGNISPQAYTNLLCTSYNAIKSANSGTAVISAAPAPTGYFGGCSGNGCDDQPWMEGLYAAGAANCMDYIGAHHNAGATSPSARSGHPTGSGHHSWYFLPQTELYFNIFRGARKLFYTEMGYASQEGVPTFSDDFGWARSITNAQQAAWLAEAASLGSSTGMVRCIIVWNIDFVRYGYDPQDGYAIIRPGGGCPACDTLHNVLGTR